MWRLPMKPCGHCVQVTKSALTLVGRAGGEVIIAPPQVCFIGSFPIYWETTNANCTIYRAA
jgi:hypothetical protein